MTTTSPPPPTPPPLVSIELVDEEHIAGRGSAECIWFVRVADAWQAAAQVAGAEVQTLDPGPGVVWRRQIELRVPRGTLLMRVQSAPRAVHRSPLEYLQGSPATARRVRRTEFRVGARGALEEQPGAAAPGGKRLR